MRSASTQGVTELARETVLGLGHLIGQHVLVAQLEIEAVMHAMSRRARLIAVLAALAAVGYALAMAGLAVVVGGRAAVGLPLVIVGVAHLVGAGAGLAFARRRARGPRAMRNTTAAMSGSLVALGGALEKVHGR